MTDNTKVCWSCSRETVKAKGNYYQCSSCGATYNTLPKPGFSPLADHGSYLQDAQGTVLTRVQRPSKTVTRRASKAREKKVNHA